MIGILIQVVIIAIVVLVCLKLVDLLVENAKWKQALTYVIYAIAAILLIKIMYSLILFVP